MLNSLLASILLFGYGFDSSKLYSPSDYNYHCPHASGEIYINSLSYEIGVSLGPDRNAITAFETILIEPYPYCTECFDITTKSKNETINIFQFQKNLASTTVDVIHLKEDGSRAVIMAKLKCYEITEFKKDVRSELLKDSLSAPYAQ